MFQAHGALLALPPAEGGKVFDLADLPLPGGPGAFLATPRRIGAEASPLAVCRT